MSTEVISTEMLHIIATRGRNWRCSQPENLKKIEKLAVSLSKVVSKCGEDEKREYINQICNEIKQLAHDYQIKVNRIR